MDATRDASGDAALFAFIAARLKGVWSDLDELQEILEGVGLELSGRTLRTAPEKATRLSPSDRADWHRLFPNTTTVPHRALNFFEAAVRLQPTDRSEAVIAQLGQVVGVVELMQLEPDGGALALVVYADRRDRDMIDGELREFGEILEWTTVQGHSREPAVHTWLNLARRALGADQDVE